MANEQHVDVVKQGAEAIAAYRKKNPDVRFDLTYANLTNCDLIGADLTGADLTFALLVDADLTNAVLTDVNLHQCDLCHSRLFGATLLRANLCGADLSYANLNNANLTSVALIDAVLNSTSVADANLESARMLYTMCCNIDFSQTRGLETVEHFGPSTIGVDTLLRSNGKIPEIFLRGCGLPDEFIAYVPTFVGTAFEYYSCFISHNKADKTFARLLYDRLQGKGIRCWLDEKQLNPGDDLYHEIDRGIRVWDKVLLCASKDSLASRWVDDEITIALEKERELFESTKKNLLKIIPLNLDGFMFTDNWQSGYRAMIRKRVAADFTKWNSDAEEFERQVNLVVKSLRTDGGKPPEPQSKLS